MKKKLAMKIFGNGVRMAEALNVKSQAIYKWPDELNQRRTDEIVGAAIRLRKDIEIPNVILFYKEDFV